MHLRGPRLGVRDALPSWLWLATGRVLPAPRRPVAGPPGASSPPLSGAPPPRGASSPSGIQPSGVPQLRAGPPPVGNGPHPPADGSAGRDIVRIIINALASAAGVSEPVPPGQERDGPPPAGNGSPSPDDSPPGQTRDGEAIPGGTSQPVSEDDGGFEAFLRLARIMPRGRLVGPMVSTLVPKAPVVEDPALPPGLPQPPAPSPPSPVLVPSAPLSPPAGAGTPIAPEVPTGIDVPANVPVADVDVPSGPVTSAPVSEVDVPSGPATSAPVTDVDAPVTVVKPAAVQVPMPADVSTQLAGPDTPVRSDTGGLAPSSAAPQNPLAASLAGLVRPAQEPRTADAVRGNPHPCPLGNDPCREPTVQGRCRRCGLRRTG
jgi:hypothetical protein